MKRIDKIALLVIAGCIAIGVSLFLAMPVIMASAVPYVARHSGLCAYTTVFDNRFGDQHLKSTVALLELYKTRHGRYPDRLSDIDLVGDWDSMALDFTTYYPNQSRTRYYVEVTRGWLCAPTVKYPPEFWTGTGYDPTLKP